MTQTAEKRSANLTGTTNRKQRQRKQLTHRIVRLAIQIAFFVLAPGAFSAAFNGVKYLFTQVGLVQGLELTAFLTLLLGLLAFTILFGRFFCGYACAFGTLGDVLYGAVKLVRDRVGLPWIVFPNGLVKVLSLVKYFVLAAICVACALGVWSAVSLGSPWVAFASILAWNFAGVEAVAWVALALIVIGMIVRERFFCQFLCPLGAVFSLMPVFGFSEYTRTRAHCAKRCGRCKDACPVGIWPDADELNHGECISCSRCVDVCPMNNVNLVAIERDGNEKRQNPRGDDAPTDRPVRKTREGWYLLRGAGIGFTVAKAAALLAVLWALGSTRFLPPFAELFGWAPFM